MIRGHYNKVVSVCVVFSYCFLLSMQLFEEHIKRTQEDNMAIQKENSKPTQKRRPFSSIVDYQDSEKCFDQRNGQTLLQVSGMLL